MANFGNYGSGKFNKILVKDITVSDDVTITGDWAVTGTLAVTSTSTFTGAVSIDSTTATTSGITGSLHTDGGVGIAGALYVGTTSALVGNVTVGSASGSGADVRFYGDLATADFFWDQDGDTNGSLTLGADTKGVDFKAFGVTTGNYVIWDQSADDLLLVGTATQLAVAGTTASTTSTTGSLRTAGGLGVAGAAFVGGNLSSAKQLCTANVGTANTGVTAVEYGDGYHHTSVLTVSQVNALTTADNAAIADGYLLYTFPAGVIVVHHAYMSMGVTATTEQQGDTPLVGLGTVIATGAVADLTTPATFQDILTGQTALADGTAEVMALGPTGAIPFVILAAAAHTIHFNVADTWADDTSADLSADIAGTVVLDWTFLA